jgi:hypothetical protein
MKKNSVRTREFQQISRFLGPSPRPKRGWHPKNKKMNIENEGESHDVIDNKGSDFVSHDVADNEAT